MSTILSIRGVRIVLIAAFLVAVVLVFILQDSHRASDRLIEDVVQSGHPKMKQETSAVKYIPHRRGQYPPSRAHFLRSL